MSGLGDSMRMLRFVRHLKVRQLYHRLRPIRRWPASTPSTPPPLREGRGGLLPTPRRRRSVFGPTTFRFLNETRTLALPRDWGRTDGPLLWWYNLHYFDDLNAEDPKERGDHHLELIHAWIDAVDPDIGVGWHPYPLSVRVSNWVKWNLGGNQPSPEMLSSLARQARYLLQNVEWHHMGNHLFANAKALILAGILFDGDEAAAWRRAGWEVLHSQLGDQILPDGGHFERSPMYHLIVLEDLLDILNALEAYGEASGSDAQRLRIVGGEMVRWVRAISHRDGEIPLLNDAALQVAPRPTELVAYAERLSAGASCCEATEAFRPLGPEGDSVWLEASGYVRGEVPRAVALFDVGPLGPDWIPGHGHADTLSFELSIDGRRIVTDSGTSTYAAGSVRDEERGTAAHNTIVVDGANSSEVWGGFRVGRRARVTECDAKWEGGALHVRATHDGYRRLRPGGVRHTRTWHLYAGHLQIVDRLEGRGRHDVAVHLHFHPEVTVEASGSAECLLWTTGMRRPAKLIVAAPLVLRVREGSYSPEFGVRLPSVRAEAVWSGQLPATFSTSITWDA
jgi:uncharacterized heparinase superfamily protein